MTLKLLPILAFLGWTFICWRWYVCEIKQVCTDNNQTASTSSYPTTEPITVQDSVAGVQMSADKESALSPMKEELPTSNPPSSTSKTTIPTSPIEATPPISTSDVDINRFSVVEDGDLITIHFPYNSIENEANVEAESFLATLAAQLNQSKRKLVITGHTDSVGDGVSNEKIALKRAQNIRDKLISNGVAVSQITCQTFGERKPIATNDLPQGRYKNRRVEFRLK